MFKLLLVVIVGVVTLSAAQISSVARPLPPILQFPTTNIFPTTTGIYPTLPYPPTAPPCEPPIKCGENEVYLPLPIAPVCDTVCKRIGTECTESLYTKPQPGCFCLPDHARNEDNVCVPIAKCGIKCEYFG